MAKEANLPPPEWYEEHQAKWREGYSSLPQDEWNIRFDDLKPNSYVLSVSKWRPDMDKGVMLYGPPGTGKSTLCKATINRWARENYKAVFITVPDALDKIRNAYKDETTTLEIQLEYLRRPDLLIFDDLGTERATDFVDEKLFMILDWRMRHRKHTWFSTNLTMAEIKAKYAARFTDRLLKACYFVSCDGESFRRLEFKNELI